MENGNFTWAGKLNISDKSEDGKNNSNKKIYQNIIKVKEMKKKCNYFIFLK